MRLKTFFILALALEFGREGTQRLDNSTLSPSPPDVFRKLGTKGGAIFAVMTPTVAVRTKSHDVCGSIGSTLG